MKDIQAEKKWDEIYAKQVALESGIENHPVEVLLQNKSLLPDRGTSLDLACGLGANAIFLAEQGFISHAWDISSQAIDKLKKYCDEHSVSIAAQVRDIEQQPPEKNTFDIICVSYYLERALVSKIMAALKPKGLLFYQTFTQEKVTDTGPKNSAYRLQQNELLALFSRLHILFYQEYGRVGDLENGLRDVAMLVAQKR